MEDTLYQIRTIVGGRARINREKLNELFSKYLKNELKGLQIENYIGDYPTFLEPVHLGKDVKIGDDVLIGPNVFIGDNCKIGDYVQLANTIIYENVIIGENIKLENCIVMHDSQLLYKNDSEKNCVIDGSADSKENMTIIRDVLL